MRTDSSPPMVVRIPETSSLISAQVRSPALRHGGRMRFMARCPPLLLLLLVPLRAGAAPAQAEHRPVIAIAVVEHLLQAPGSSAAVLDLRLLCAAAGPEGCGETVRDAAAGMALHPARFRRLVRSA
jgi:hypothetical protein